MLTIGEQIGDFHVVRKIGQGGMAQVYLVHSTRFDRFFAAKVINMNTSTVGPPALDTELSIMLRLDHNNIVRIYDTFRYPDKLILILDYCPNGSMEEYLIKYGPLPEDEFRKMTVEILDALSVMHEAKIAHRDIKPGNILIDAFGHPKLADFGISLSCEGKIKQFSGSRPFMAPELIQHQQYDPFPADMWALGVTLYILYTGHLPWSNDVATMTKEIVLGCPNYDDTIPHDLWKIMAGLMTTQPEKRMTLDELRAHPFFSRLSLSDISKPAKKLARSGKVLIRPIVLQQPRIVDTRRSDGQISPRKSHPKSFLGSKIRSFHSSSHLFLPQSVSFVNSSESALIQ